ncbi:hypothetical protein REPUB_Repub04eG0008200 [Reevesia pubescens]
MARQLCISAAPPKEGLLESRLRLKSPLDIRETWKPNAMPVLEHDTPEELLANEESAFSKMVQSTGPANAKYLHSLVFGGEENSLSIEHAMQLDGRKREQASSQWAAAAQFAVSISPTSSQIDLQRFDIGDMSNILPKTEDPVITLQDVLDGKHDKVIDNIL